MIISWLTSPCMCWNHLLRIARSWEWLMARPMSRVVQRTNWCMLASEQMYCSRVMRAVVDGLERAS